MGTEHSHGSASEAQHGGRAYKRRLLWSLALVGGYFIVEVVGGLVANSLALLSDAGHMLTDVLGLGMAAAAIHAADRSSGGDPQKTFGLYRLEILAALANAVLLFGVAIYILYEAVQRFQDPPAVLGLPVLVVASVGLVVNLVVLVLLRKGSGASINVEGAYLEVLADTFGSIGVIASAIVLQTTGYALIDPIFGVVIGVFVLPRTWRLGRRAVRILIQAAPPELDVGAVQAALRDVDGVKGVHDLHVWTLTSGMEVCSAHLCLAPGADAEHALVAARELLQERFSVVHATLQLEPATIAECHQDEQGEHRW